MTNPTQSMKDLLRSKRFRRGSAVLELGVTLLVLMYVTFGSIEWGYYLYCKNQLIGAAREGARAAIVSGATNTDVNSAITTAITVAGLKNTYTVTTNPSAVSSQASGNPVYVTIAYNWGNGLGLSSFSRIPVNKTMTVTMAMRKE